MTDILRGSYIPIAGTWSDKEKEWHEAGSAFCERMAKHGLDAAGRPGQAAAPSRRGDGPDARAGGGLRGWRPVTASETP